MRHLAILLACLPLPALALSCAPYGVSDAYIAADAARAPYVIVVGRLDFDPALAPRSHQNDTPAFTRIPARIRGTQYGSRGKTAGFETQAHLDVSCSGPWCPKVQSGEALMFLKREGDGYVLEANACGGFWFRTPKAAQLGQLRDCLNGKDCVPSRRR